MKLKERLSRIKPKILNHTVNASPMRKQESKSNLKKDCLDLQSTDRDFILVHFFHSLLLFIYFCFVSTGEPQHGGLVRWSVDIHLNMRTTN